MKYNCVYITGSGNEYNDGVWELKKTPKTETLTKVSEYMSGVYAMHKVGKRFKIGVNTGNPARHHKDGTFTVYFGQAGTPYYFTPTINK